MDLNVEHPDHSRRGAGPSAAGTGTREVFPTGRRSAVRRGSPSTSPLLTISEVADLIGVHRSTLYRTIGRAGLPLPVIRVGATMRVPRVAVERLLSGDLASGVATLAGRVESASYCSVCGSAFPASSRPTCSAARRSSSPMAAV